MSAAHLIERCREAGVELVAKGQELRVRGHGLKPFLAELRERKAEVLDHLQQIATGAAEPADEPEPLQADPAECGNWTATPEGPAAAPPDPRTRPAPRPDAPDRQWHQYFTREQRIIREDGRAEVETFGTVIPKSQLMNHSSRTRREVAEYLSEFRPGPDTPDEPCHCGDAVFYKLDEHSRCQCRSCQPPAPYTRIKWFVLPRRIG